MVDMPNPTTETLETEAFKALWEVVKLWDIEVEDRDGYSGGTGSHVQMLLDALEAKECLKSHTPQSQTTMTDWQAKATKILEQYNSALAEDKEDWLVTIMESDMVILEEIVKLAVWANQEAEKFLRGEQ